MCVCVFSSQARLLIRRALHMYHHQSDQHTAHILAWTHVVPSSQVRKILAHTVHT